MSAALLAWCLVVLGAQAAGAVVQALGGGARNALVAGTLATPVHGTPIHPTVTGGSAGTVQLSWTAALTRAVTFVIERAPTSAPTTWTTVASPASGSVCTGAVPGTVSCSSSDTGAAYGSQYVYRVTATLGGWSATGSSQLALSLKASSGTVRSPADLRSISASSSTTVWAVGANCTVSYWNGTAWTGQTASTTYCPAGTTLNSVFASGGFPVIGGNYGAAFGCTSGCTSASPAWYGKSVAPLNITAIYATSGTTIFGVGERCTAWYYDQGTGTVAIISPTVAQCGYRTLRAIYGVGTGHLVVAGDGGLLLVCTAGCTTNGGATWVAPTVSPAVSGTPTYWGAWAGDVNNVLVVGDNGAMVGCRANCDTAGGTWNAIDSGTTARLRSVTQTSGGDAYAVGDGGKAVTCSWWCTSYWWSNWGTEATGTTSDLSSVTAVGSVVWAVGANGTARRSTGGGTWAALSPAVPTTATSTALLAADVTATTVNDASVLGGRVTWPATAVPSTCTGTAIELVPTATVPSGTWTVGRVQAVVRALGNDTPGTGASLRLLVSPDAGSTWTSYAVTLPSAYNTAATTTIDVTATVGTTAQVSAMRWCLVGSSGSGPPLSTWLDLAHVDVN